ncbi:transcriptional regulator [Sulfurospirillum sp. T05]|uniref:Transcriptional regulator n=1 Tax=Sulfurospirillum tamanense TaxID=2813362 RepID=A0ABS2WQ81_9BACT|nr:transcriptional regulator [Sulfurospirillum tamanensis]MBN2963839.1 transcriptional regulator [Sulfurospirillum tamanensis]
MKAKILRVGIMSKEEYKKRTIAIAKGEYTLKKNEPKVWFESVKSMGQILSFENQELLKLIIANKPQSLTELEQMSGRKKSNLSRTLKTLERYGIVELEKENKGIVPKVKATDFHVEFGIRSVA